MDELSTRIKQTTVSQFVVGGRKVYIIADWMDYDDKYEEDLFHIRLFDEDVCWKGKFSKAFAEEFSKEFCEEPQVYYSRVKESLNPIDQGLFKYDLSYDNADSAKFCWKRCYEDGKVVLVHGLVPLHRVPNSNKDELLEFLMNENRTLRNTADRLNATNNQIRADLLQYRNELDQFVESKNSLESKLYGKFVALLNAKKARIKLLEEHISQCNLLTEL